jgi:hypothetical protein
LAVALSVLRIAVSDFPFGMFNCQPLLTQWSICHRHKDKISSCGQKVVRISYFAQLENVFQYVQCYYWTNVEYKRKKSYLNVLLPFGWLNVDEIKNEVFNTFGLFPTCNRTPCLELTTHTNHHIIEAVQNDMS